MRLMVNVLRIDKALRAGLIREKRKIKLPSGKTTWGYRWVKPLNRLPMADTGQMDLFDPVQAEKRVGPLRSPEERPFFQEALTRLEQIAQKTRVVGVGIAKDLVEHGAAEILGKRLPASYFEATAKGVAEVCQIYRDPRFETFRYIFVDADNRVIGHTAVSSRMPGKTSVFPEGTQSKKGQEIVSDIKARMVDKGAVGVWFVHNHPSGNTVPSIADISVTRAMYDQWGEFIQGHVVINHNRYSAINGNGSLLEENALIHWGQGGDADPLLTPGIQHDSLGFRIADPEAAVSVLKSMENRDSFSMVYLDNQNTIRAVEEVPVEFMGKDDAGFLKDYSKDHCLKYGATAVMVSTVGIKSSQAGEHQHFITDLMKSVPWVIDGVFEINGSPISLRDFDMDNAYALELPQYKRLDDNFNPRSELVAEESI